MAMCKNSGKRGKSCADRSPKVKKNAAFYQSLRATEGNGVENLFLSMSYEVWVRYAHGLEAGRAVSIWRPVCELA
jgi:hypothetical protein